MIHNSIEYPETPEGLAEYCDRLEEEFDRDYREMDRRVTEEYWKSIESDESGLSGQPEDPTDFIQLPLAAGATQSFPAVHELPPEWFGGTTVVLRFKEEVGGNWTLSRAGIRSKLFLRLSQADGVLWEGHVGSLPVDLTGVQPELVTEITIATPEDHESV